MRPFFILFLFSCFYSQSSSAQIAAPDLLCVKGDTLFWEIPVNNCGPFISYDIYISPDPGGPFTLLTSVNDPATDFHFNPNPSGQLLYYYLTSNHDCPGEIQLSSDTLNNRPPEVSPIRSASVIGGVVELNWYPSPSPETYAYIIYRETNIGVIPIDTVFSGTSYTDPDAVPGTQSESYFVNALDRCGNTSIFDVKHTTMFLQGEAVPCEQAIALNWNPYDHWQNGIDFHEIWVSEEGAPFALFEGSAAADPAYSFPVDNDGSEYCFYVVAQENVTGARARSSEFCITADIIQPADDTYIRNVTVLPDNSVDVTWGWNTLAEITQADVLRSDMNGNYASVFSENIQPPLPVAGNYNDTAADPASGTFFYQIETIDDCGDASRSTYGSTIFLTASPLADNTNTVTWTAMDIENAVPTSYDVFKVSGTQETLIATVDASMNSYEDAIDPAEPADAQACYYVIGKAVLTVPDGSTSSIQSRSNNDCIEQDVIIQVPNAFAPEGFNQEFRPLLTFADAADYRLQIFDRYGKKLFESRSPEDGWRGKSDGKKQPQGVYVYYIRVTQLSGREVEKKGTVLLIR